MVHSSEVADLREQEGEEEREIETSLPTSPQSDMGREVEEGGDEGDDEEDDEFSVPSSSLTSAPSILEAGVLLAGCETAA
jgi:hypothetical protein